MAHCCFCKMDTPPRCTESISIPMVVWWPRPILLEWCNCGICARDDRFDTGRDNTLDASCTRPFIRPWDFKWPRRAMMGRFGSGTCGNRHPRPCRWPGSVWPPFQPTLIQSRVYDGIIRMPVLGVVNFWRRARWTVPSRCGTRDVGPNSRHCTDTRGRFRGLTYFSVTTKATTRRWFRVVLTRLSNFGGSSTLYRA